jgi:hypothetical protein
MSYGRISSQPLDERSLTQSSHRKTDILPKFEQPPDEAASRPYGNRANMSHISNGVKVPPTTGTDSHFKGEW